MFSKMLKKSVICLLIISLLIMSTVTAFASEVETDNDTEKLESEFIIDNDSDKRETDIYERLPLLLQDVSEDPTIGVGELEKSILNKETYTEGLVIKHEIENVDVFKSALQLKYPAMSELELGKTILLSLGDSEDFIASLPEEKIIEATGYISVIQTESFFKQTADGLKIEISEQDYYTAVSQIEETEDVGTDEQSVDVDNALSVSVRSSTSYDETETLDSYIKLTSTAYKTNPYYAAIGRNYFTLRGEVEWTKTPFCQGKDILAIASSGNVDDKYIAYAGAYWPNFSSGLYDYAYIDENGGEGEMLSGNALKIYNPSIYGVAANVQVGLSQEGPVLEYVYAYYGISTQNDVTCQVGYAHRTIGFGDPSVSIDSSGSISFSIGLVSTMNDYYGRAFTLYHESYAVSLDTPDENATISSTSAAPTFKWTLQHGLPEQYILEIDYLRGAAYMTKYVSDRTNYTLSQSDWQKLINDSSFTNSVKEIRWRIRIDYTLYPGESYYTDWSYFTITGVPLTTQETLTISGSTRYTEKIMSLAAGGYKDFYITFTQGGTKLIQTFGAKDTVIELYSSSGSLITSNDDGGYSLNELLAYYCSANVQYKIRVRFYSSSVYGETKLAITPAYGARRTDISSITSYEDIYAIENSTGFTWSTYAQPNYTRVITFKAPSSGNYTFEIDSDFDTYIYVIDPRSSSAIVYNVNYNDDSGTGMNPCMTTYLSANVPYLIIYSAYNPNSLSETTDLTVYIGKH